MGCWLTANNPFPDSRKFGESPDAKKVMSLLRQHPFHKHTESISRHFSGRIVMLAAFSGFRYFAPKA